ncbi:uroporphyrinogen-III synthase [Ichthyobacterium seriolicida]|uniref:Uroporphyrinogen-III synthase n=1 Tax=Ichthyobacterium seriolicida TaxID=242600 RepID=A0A1J1DWE6_9FLAO|nr:uroporphyrinogen-III synthase [Ichthyobacterium seriolicida]BAV94185.1 uroporphyrinogen -III synthase [Ichthyobacterium seriolicida]
MNYNTKTLDSDRCKRVRSILVSQPEKANGTSPYDNLTNNYNIKIDFIPFIEVEGVPELTLRKEEKLNLSNFTSVIFTSKNAIDNFFRVANEMRFDPKGFKYFCQFEVLANYLQIYIDYKKRNVFIGKKTIQDMAGYLKKHSKEKFLLPSSDILNSTTVDCLNKLGINWTRSCMYKTVSSDLSNLKDVSYDMLVFFSPLGIKSLFDNFPEFKQNDTRIAVYGSSTLEAVERRGLICDIKAPTVESTSMIMNIEKYVELSNKK